MSQSFHTIIENIINRARKMRQVILYGLIGVSALALEVAVYYLLTQQLDTALWLSNAAGVLAGLVFGFTLNARYNFRVNQHKRERFLRYGVISFAGYMLTTTLIFTATHFLETTPLVAKLLSLPPYFVFQYNCNRLFTFKADNEFAPATTNADA